MRIKLETLAVVRGAESSRLAEVFLDDDHTEEVTLHIGDGPGWNVSTLLGLDEWGKLGSRLALHGGNEGVDNMMEILKEAVKYCDAKVYLNKYTCMEGERSEYAST